MLVAVVVAVEHTADSHLLAGVWTSALDMAFAVETAAADVAAAAYS